MATSELLALSSAVVPLSPILEEILHAALYKYCLRSALMGQELIQAPLVYWQRDGVAAFQGITVKYSGKSWRQLEEAANFEHIRESLQNFLDCGSCGIVQSIH